MVRQPGWNTEGMRSQKCLGSAGLGNKRSEKGRVNSQLFLETKSIHDTLV